MSVSLPKGFQPLERFVEKWARETTDERVHARATSSMEEIREFYDVAVEHAEAALAYCEKFPIDALPEDAARLFRLILGLGQAAVAIEIHGQPRGPGVPWPHDLTIERGPFPFG